MEELTHQPTVYIEVFEGSGKFLTKFAYVNVVAKTLPTDEELRAAVTELGYDNSIIHVSSKDAQPRLIMH